MAIFHRKPAANLRPQALDQRRRGAKWRRVQREMRKDVSDAMSRKRGDAGFAHAENKSPGIVMGDEQIDLGMNRAMDRFGG